MDASSAVAWHGFVESGDETQTVETRLSSSCDSSSSLATDAGFDCNICLEFAQEPVVTLCGHLFCWPCIYKWLHVHPSAQPCPVCKSTISASTLIPLYGRGKTVISRVVDDEGIPHRPSAKWTYDIQQASRRENHHHHDHGDLDDHRQGQNAYAPTSHLSGMNFTTRIAHPTIGGIAVAAFPWLMGSSDVGFYQYSHGNHVGNNNGGSQFYHLVGSGPSSPRMREIEQEVRRGLDKLLVFISCFALLCLLFF